MGRYDYYDDGIDGWDIFLIVVSSVAIVLVIALCIGAFSLEEQKDNFEKKCYQAAGVEIVDDGDEFLCINAERKVILEEEYK